MCRWLASRKLGEPPPGTDLQRTPSPPPPLPSKRPKLGLSLTVGYCYGEQHNPKARNISECEVKVMDASSFPLVSAPAS